MPKDQIVPGCAYTFKDQKSYIYLGRMEYNDKKCVRIDNPNSKYSYDSTIHLYDYYERKKGHIFHYLNNKGESSYIIESGFTKIATRDTHLSVPNLAELVVEYESSSLGGKFKSLIIEDDALNFETETFKDNGHYGSYQSKEYDGKYYVKLSNGTLRSFTLKEVFEKEYDRNTNKYNVVGSKGFLKCDHISSNVYSLENDQLRVKYSSTTSYYNTNSDCYISREDLESTYTIKKVFVELENGTKMDINQFI